MKKRDEYTVIETSCEVPVVETEDQSFFCTRCGLVLDSQYADCADCTPIEYCEGCNENEIEKGEFYCQSCKDYYEDDFDDEDNNEYNSWDNSEAPSGSKDYPHTTTLCGCPDCAPKWEWQARHYRYKIVPSGIVADCESSQFRDELGYNLRWAQSWEMLQGDVTDLLGFKPQEMCPPEAMADFYLLGYMKHKIEATNRQYVARDAKLEFLSFRVSAAYHALVAEAADTFAKYMDMAIGGELRHMMQFDTRGILPRKRLTAGLAWSHIRRQIGLPALKKAEEWFIRGGYGAYGGKAWATGTRYLYDYLNGTLRPDLFVDRVFTLQHNTGSFLNKVRWGSGHKGSSMRLELMGSIIGEAHAATQTDWQVLLRECSPDVNALFVEWWQALYRVALIPPTDTITMPTRTKTGRMELIDTITRSWMGEYLISDLKSAITEGVYQKYFFEDSSRSILGVYVDGVTLYVRIFATSWVDYPLTVLNSTLWEHGLPELNDSMITSITDVFNLWGQAVTKVGFMPSTASYIMDCANAYFAGTTIFDKEPYMDCYGSHAYPHEMD